MNRKERQREYHRQWYQKNKHLYATPKRNNKSSTYCMQVLYSVWNNITDEVVIIDGNYKECAKAMGISPNSFYAIVTKARQGKLKKWLFKQRLIKESERR